MPEKFQNIGLKQIRKLVPSEGVIELGDDFFIMDVRYSDNLQFLKYPCRSDAYIAIFCKSGKLDVEINLRTYSIKDRTLLVSTPGNILKVNDIPPDGLDKFNFVVMAISKDYLSNINFDYKLVIDDKIGLLSNPCVQLDDKAIGYCDQYVSLISELMKSDSFNKRDAVGSLIASLFYVLSGLLEGNFKKDTELEAATTPGRTRVRLLFEHFMELVTKYHDSERSMAFYASRLGLTPKYLSKLIKEASGRSGPDWIDSFVILEAKNMLKYMDVSIKEIVFKLHFPNPPVFYKFFKSRTGMTPAEYRNG